MEEAQAGVKPKVMREEEEASRPHVLTLVPHAALYLFRCFVMVSKAALSGRDM